MTKKNVTRRKGQQQTTLQDDVVKMVMLDVAMDNLTKLWQNMITQEMVGVQSGQSATCDRSCTSSYCEANPKADECSAVDLGVNSSMWKDANFNCISATMWS